MSIMIAEIAAAGLAVDGEASASPVVPEGSLTTAEQSDASVTDRQITASAATRLADATNDYRAAHGLSILTENEQLNAHSQAWAESLAAVGTISHDPNLAASGARTENIAVVPSGGDVTAAIGQWENSADHKANLERARSTQVGHGVATIQTGQFAGQHVVVQRMA